jgi:toxin ParE1/3/4
VRIDFHPEATDELNYAANWYLGRSPKAAQQFAVEIERALEKIAADPLRFVHVGKHVQACPVERFPYQLVFRVDPDSIFLIAVADARRRPRYWRRRV